MTYFSVLFKILKLDCNTECQITNWSRKFLSVALTKVLDYLPMCPIKLSSIDIHDFCVPETENIWLVVKFAE